MTELSSEMLHLAERLANRAGEMLGERLTPTAVERKPDDSVVTAADREIQSQITAAILDAYPDHAVLGEERTSVPSAGLKPIDARFVWVIDPVDGTRNYAGGFPCFSTSIAVLDQGRPVVGVVREHNLQRLYSATRGQGALRDGRRIQVGGSGPRHDHLVGIGSSKDDFNVKVLRQWVGTKGMILRNVGSAAMHLALVADGGLSAAFGTQCKIWDLAAGVVLVREAGGLITDPIGQPLTSFDLTLHPDRDIPFLAGEPMLHERLLPVIAQAAP